MKTNHNRIDGFDIINIDLPDDWDKSTIQFFGDPTPIIISTSNGYVYGNKIYLDDQSTNVKLMNKSQHIECVASLMSGEKVLQYQNRRIDNLSSNKKSDEEQWQFKCNLEEDLHVKIIRRGDKSSFFSFGQKSELLEASDFVFNVGDNDTFNLPIEIIWKKKKLYEKGKDVGIFELINIGQDNIFSKSLVSNTLNLSDFPQYHAKSIVHLSPSGEILELKTDPETGLCYAR